MSVQRGMTFPPLNAVQIEETVARACLPASYEGKKVLLIIPDGTRTAPVGLLFRLLHRRLGPVTQTFDILVALGTHQPMTEAAICERLEISWDERNTTYGQVRFFNHAWDNPADLKRIGSLSGREIRDLTAGLFEMDVPIEINKRLFDYDQVIIVGPVFPHEVVGFSGGNKYLNRFDYQPDNSKIIKQK